jgi:uncharacterized protein DUF397
MTHPAPPRWRKSTRSGSQSDCVEVEGGLSRVRDSKNAGVVLAVTPTAWAGFLAVVKTDGFDNN